MLNLILNRIWGMHISNDIDIAIKLIQEEPSLKINNQSVEKEWLEKFAYDGYFMGLYKDEDHNLELIGCLIAENLIDKGVLLWFIVIKEEYRNSSIGTEFLIKFENYLREMKGKEWIFLNGTKQSLNFYKNNGYNISENQVTECIKNL